MSCFDRLDTCFLIAGEAVRLPDLLSLESTLELELRGDAGLALSEDNILKVFGVRAGTLTDFLKYVVQLEEVPLFHEAVRRSFDTFFRGHGYNADLRCFYGRCKLYSSISTSWALDDLY